MPRTDDPRPTSRVAPLLTAAAVVFVLALTSLLGQPVSAPVWPDHATAVTR
ncbi:MAG: hypothetical protein AB7G23_20950 [Vicinamibacterales bacterium]